MNGIYVSIFIAAHAVLSGFIQINGSLTGLSGTDPFFLGLLNIATLFLIIFTPVLGAAIAIYSQEFMRQLGDDGSSNVASVLSLMTFVAITTSLGWILGLSMGVFMADVTMLLVVVFLGTAYVAPYFSLTGMLLSFFFVLAASVIAVFGLMKIKALSLLYSKRHCLIMASTDTRLHVGVLLFFLLISSNFVFSSYLFAIAERTGAPLAIDSGLSTFLPTISLAISFLTMLWYRHPMEWMMGVSHDNIHDEIRSKKPKFYLIIMKVVSIGLPLGILGGVSMTILASWIAPIVVEGHTISPTLGLNPMFSVVLGSGLMLLLGLIQQLNHERAPMKEKEEPVKATYQVWGD